MVLRLLLRPAVLASVLVHGAAVATAYIALDPLRAERDPLVVASLESEAVPYEEPPSLVEPEEPPDEAPTVREPVLVDPPPAIEVLFEPDAPAVEASRPVIGLGAPPAHVRTSLERPPSSGTGEATSVAVAVPAARSSETRRGGATRLAIEHPDNARPAYPAAALSRGIEGTVWLTFTVLSDGTVAGLSIERSSGSSELDAAAFSAASTWRYQPKLADGVAVEESLRVPVRFRIGAR